MSGRSYEVSHDLSAFMMVVLIVALVMGYLLSRSRWLTWERGERFSPMSRNKADARVKLTFGNFIMNINRSKSQM